MDDVRAGPSRPLESTSAVVCFDALRVEIRAEGVARNKAVYLAIGLHCLGRKASLGLRFDALRDNHALHAVNLKWCRLRRDASIRIRGGRTGGWI